MLGGALLLLLGLSLGSGRHFLGRRLLDLDVGLHGLSHRGCFRLVQFGRLDRFRSVTG